MNVNSSISSPAPTTFVLTQHLKDAAAINTTRKPIYATLTKGKSLWLSRILILAERIAALFAYFIDKSAMPFQKQGIPIITNDFVSMDAIHNPEDKPRYQNQADAETIANVKNKLSEFRKRISSYLDKNDFYFIANDAYLLIQALKLEEERSQSHFAMTRHLVESIGLTALNAIAYAKVSHANTIPLSKRVINFQKLGLWTCVFIDKLAQRCHALGVGIIVNDVPHIPFESQFTHGHQALA